MNHSVFTPIFVKNKQRIAQKSIVQQPLPVWATTLWLALLLLLQFPLRKQQPLESSKNN
jgi:hypothetical protein